MLLNSLFLIVLIFSSNIYICLTSLLLFGMVRLLIDKKVIFPEKRYFFFLFITSVLIQLVYNQEGEILYGNKIFVITKVGIIAGAVLAIKIYGMMLISKNSNFKKLFNGRFKKQALIFEIVVKVIPEIIKMPKTMINPGKTVRFILRRVYRELRIIKD